MLMRTIRRVSVLDTRFDVFWAVPGAELFKPLRSAASSGRRFISGSRKALFVGTVHPERYLRDPGEHTVLQVSRLFDEQDRTLFASRYAASGRAPYAPRSMTGLILYGVMQGVHSLRELERLARLDPGCT